MENPRKPLDDARAVLVARMRELRESCGRSQETAAAALGIGQAAYSEMERGLTAVRRRDLATLAMLFGMPLSEAFPMYADPLAVDSEGEPPGDRSAA